MGVLQGTDFLKAAGKATTFKAIVKKWLEDNNGEAPTVGVDVSIYLVRALSHFATIDQASAVPPLPATHVASVVWEWFDLLQTAGFIPIAVFDGQRYPPKGKTCERRYEKIPQEIAKLQEMYKDPLEYS